MRRTVLSYGLVAAVLIVFAACETSTAPTPTTDVQIAIAAGADTQTAVIGTPVAVAPSVRVTRSNGTPIVGVTVVFAQVRGATSSARVAVLTDPNGVASMTAWTLGTRAGIQELLAYVASSSAQAAQVSFFANAQSGTAVTATLAPVLPQMSVGDTLRAVLTFRDAEQNETPPPAPVTFSSSDTTTVRVSSTGLLTAIAPGVSTITAVAGTTTRAITAAVRSGPITAPSVTTLTVGRGLIQLAIGSGRIGYTAGGVMLYRVDLAGSTVTDSLDVGIFITAIAVTPSGDRAYLGHSGSLTIVSLPAFTVSGSITLSGNAQVVTASPDGAHIFVAQDNGVVARVAVSDDAVTPVSVTGSLVGMAIHPTAPRLFVNSTVGALHEINTSTLSVTRTVLSQGGAGPLAISPNDSRVFAARSSDSLLVRSPTDLSRIGALPASDNIRWMTFTADGRHLLSTRTNSNEIDMYDAFTLQRYRSEFVVGARALAADPASTDIWVASDFGRLVRLRF
ncbi:MAG: Ig-like domain-containing protein [Gemmatimonadaceae bacterium]|nr:Ig-like domain-containing protein [Gemmatimonadaceae bacterium]